MPVRGVHRDWAATGLGGAEEKARIVAESYEAGGSVSAVARRYALSPQQLFAWRRAARRAVAEMPPSEPLFAPAVVAAPAPMAKRPTQPRGRKAARDVGVIELEFDGIVMRVGRGADARTLASVIRALKATS